MNPAECVAANLARVSAEAAAACRRAGRGADSVRLMAAVKTVPPEAIRAAAAAGVRLFGENRVQEREAKQAALADLEADWHFIGRLQNNKAAKAVALFTSVDSVDSAALAERLNRLAQAAGRSLGVLMEVNIAAEPQKSGALPADAERLAASIAALPALRLGGCMAVPPAGPAEAARPWFAALRQLSDRLRGYGGGERWELSMGMSEDFAVAIEEGATIIRLGRALFGPRPAEPAE
ncbi:MAG: YggS family pyridoxal phosphate-dependent enzyme [Terriglobales bacterium]